MSRDGSLRGRFLNLSRKINGAKSIVKAIAQVQNLVMVLGNEMVVQHTHRWQNRDVAFVYSLEKKIKKS